MLPALERLAPALAAAVLAGTLVVGCCLWPAAAGAGAPASPLAAVAALSLAGLAASAAAFVGCARRYAAARGWEALSGLGAAAMAFLVNFLFCMAYMLLVNLRTAFTGIGTGR